MKDLLNFLEPLGFTVVRYDPDDRYVLATARGVDVYTSRGKSHIVYRGGAEVSPDEARRLGKTLGYAAMAAEFLETKTRDVYTRA